MNREKHLLNLLAKLGCPIIKMQAIHLYSLIGKLQNCSKFGVIWPIYATLCDKVAELRLTRKISGLSRYKSMRNLRRGNRVAMAKLLVRERTF